MRLQGFPALAVVSTIAALSGGCAHTLESAREDRVVVAVDHGGGAGPAIEVTEPPPVIIAEPIVTRPRLSRTVTLGEGTVEPVYAAAPQQREASGGPNVVVNNTITVVGGPTVYGGYGGGYSGYGGRSSGGGRADPPRGQTVQPQPWAPSGWEGAGRTAAPGQTPHVGGNWAPPVSHGPRQLK